MGDVDLKLEARRKKFENTAPLSLVSKKICLKKAEADAGLSKNQNTGYSSGDNLQKDVSIFLVFLRTINLLSHTKNSKA